MRSYSRTFKLMSIALVKEQMAAHGIKFEEASRRVGVEESLLRRWTREATANPIFAFPGRGHRRISNLGSSYTIYSSGAGRQPPIAVAEIQTANSES
jgi:transposase-like protein